MADTSILQYNRLATEASAYLRQHAEQDICWQPWSEQTLAAARELRRPLLLSVGYSACHWCHVMSREAFSDPEIVNLMNANFVNIKIDREERPDLDMIYQSAHQVMRAKGGGWPLTVFADYEDMQPFFTGTYFPLQPHPQIPSFRQVLLALIDIIRNRPEDIRAEKHEIARRISSYMDLTDIVADGDLVLCHESARAALQTIMDSSNGGFGGAPKFPMMPQLQYCLLAGDDTLRQHALASLRQYARSGLYDHVGGGFFRYCVDAAWRLPHFEKMLYDNALLLLGCVQAARLEPEQMLWQRTANGVVNWLLREMRTPAGGFISAIDADDMDGVEGGGYLWSKEQLQLVLDSACSDFAEAFGMSEPAQLDGRWHLQASSGANDNGSYDDCLSKLLQARGDMPAHRIDDKVLSQCNGLVIAAMVMAARVFARPEWARHARQAYDCIAAGHVGSDGRLLRLSVADKASGKAFAGDYAAMIIATLELLQYEWQSELLPFAAQLADSLLADFMDQERGGFYLNDGSEILLHRPRPYTDDAIPAANALAITALHRLGVLLSEPRYLDAAAVAVEAAMPWLQQAPLACCGTLLASHAMQRPCVLLSLATTDDITAWREAVADNADLYVVPTTAAQLPPSLVAHTVSAGGATLAVVCAGNRCLPPVASATELTKILCQ